MQSRIRLASTDPDRHGTLPSEIRMEETRNIDIVRAGYRRGFSDHHDAGMRQPWRVISPTSRFPEEPPVSGDGFETNVSIVCNTVVLYSTRLPTSVPCDPMTASHPTTPEDIVNLSNDELATAVATLAAHIHAATWRLLTLIAELDRRGVWADQGALTCAHWLGWACGIDTHTAREKVRVARVLEGLPLLSAAAARGELGYSKLRALTRIATAENEADLVDIGLHGTAQHVEKFVRLYRQAERAQETERADAQHGDRELTYWYEDDGTLVLHGRFPPEIGARILSALDAAMEAHATEQPASEWNNEGEAPDVPGGTSRCEETESAPIPGPSAGGRGAEAGASFSPNGPGGTHPRRPSHTVRRADALAWMAERVFEEGEAPALSPHRHEVVVHIDAEVLTHRGAGRCEMEHHTAIASETARRLCCDGGIVATVDGPRGEPLTIGRRTRSISPALRRALMSRDRGCRFPGCPATHRLHGHHVRHWAEGGETGLDNLVLLCPVHHRLVHEGGFDVRRLDDGVLRFTAPNGNPVRAPAPREASSPGTVAAQNDALGLTIDSETAMAHWHGERIDYDHAVMVTMHSWNSDGSHPDTERNPEVHEKSPAPSVAAFPPSSREPLHTPWWLRENPAP